MSLISERTGLAGWTALRQAGLVTLGLQDFGGKRLWRPQIRFRQKPLRQCPFLLNDVDERGRYRGLCQLHPRYKPLVCRLSPLAREVVDDGVAPAQSWSAVAPVDGCPGMGRGRQRILKPPRELAARLDREVLWVRTLISNSDLLSERDPAETFFASDPLPS